MAQDLLLEIGVEEMPSAYMPRAAWNYCRIEQMK